MCVLALRTGFSFSRRSRLPPGGLPLLEITSVLQAISSVLSGFPVSGFRQPTLLLCNVSLNYRDYNWTIAQQFFSTNDWTYNHNGGKHQKTIIIPLLFSFGRGKKPGERVRDRWDLLAIMHRNAWSLTGKYPLKDVVIKYNRTTGIISDSVGKNQTLVLHPRTDRFHGNWMWAKPPSDALEEESKFWSDLLGELETVIHLFKRFFVYKTNLL